MNHDCKPICNQRPDTNDKLIKKTLLTLLAKFGVETNSKIAFLVPGWANRILSESNQFGPGLRKTAIAYYFAHVCDLLAEFTDSQKRQLEKDISPLSNDSFFSMVHLGKEKCCDIAPAVESAEFGVSG